MTVRPTSSLWFVLSASLSLALSFLLYVQVHVQWFGPRSPVQLLGSVFAALCALALSVAALVMASQCEHPTRWRMMSIVLLLSSGAMLSVGCLQSVFIT